MLTVTITGAKYVKYYNNYEIYQSKNGIFFAIAKKDQYLDVDACYTLEECMEDIDATVEAMA